MVLTPRQRVVAFLVLTYALSTIFYVPIASSGKLHALPVFGLMWCPGAAAVILRLVTQRNLRGTGWGWGATRWQVLSYLLPPAFGAVVYGLVWLSGIGAFTTAELTKQLGVALPVPALLGLVVTVGLLSALVFALGEEIGWRGFLVPELARVASLTQTALISGAAWSVYHYPLILFADYNSRTPKWFALVVFTWMVVASSFTYAWLRLRSGSVWTGVILHASHNLYIQQVFDLLTKDEGITKYITGEFGVGLAIVYSIVACYFWRRRGEVATVPSAATTPAASPVSTA